MNNATQFPLTKRLTSIWMAAVITLILSMIGSIPIHQRAELQHQVEAIRTDIRLIDAAATQLSLATDR